MSHATTTRQKGNGASPGGRRSTRLRKALSWRNISALYVFAVIFIVFSITIPRTFLSAATWRTLLDNQAVTGLTAIALVVPLAAGVFNLAIGLQVGTASIFIGWLLVNQGVGVVSAILITAVLGALIGLGSALLIIKAHIDSFIATLGISSLLAAFITGISGGEQILGVADSLASFGTAQLSGVTYPFVALIIVAFLVWYVLEKTPAGRRVYATGGNLEAARLSGVSTSRVIVYSLIACGVLASLAGIVVTAKLANADPTIGPGYLLPAFTAAFLGSTQFKAGRFNVWGTVVSVYVLAAGVKGLQLSGAPVWIPDAFNGASLIVAVAMAKSQGRLGQPSSVRRVLGKFNLSGSGQAHEVRDAA
jgi:ribose transport system permease protein